MIELPTMTQAGYTPPQKSAPTRANPPGKPKKPKKNRKQKKGIGAAGIVSLVIFLIAVLIGSCALFLYAQTAPYSDTFLPGTTVSGYALGGLTAQEGAAALAMLTDDAVDAWRYTLTWGDQTYTLDSAAISLSVDVAATLDPLWQIGRDGNMLTRYLAMLSLRGDGRAEKPVLTYDMDAVDAFLSDIKAQVDRASVDATVTYVQGNSEPFRFTDEQTGLELETDAIRARMEECAKARREKQPLTLPSAGSTFKRPEGHFAAKLIDDCGLRGLTVGGAQVSEKHAGFIVNIGGATARDMLELMRQVEQRVFEQTGVQLEPEVRILGED